MRLVTWLGTALALAACGEELPGAGARASGAPIDAGAEDSGSVPVGLDAPGAEVPAPHTSSSAFLWQGMGHLWLREVAGFQVPHRVSLLESTIEQEKVEASKASARFTFAQGTGVDGNYMNPLGRWAMFDAPGIAVLRKTHEFTGTDVTSSDAYPQAHVSEKSTLTMPLPAGLDDHGLVATAVLQGFGFESSCDPSKQPVDRPCNSDGAWPFEFEFGVDECTIVDRDVSCGVRLKYARAWTPNKGGIPGIEEKPLNQKLDYRLKLAIAIVVGKSDDFAFHSDQLTATGAIHNENASVVKRSVPVPGKMKAVTAGFSSIGFRLFKTLKDESANHLGRYIGGLNLGLINTIYDPNQAKFFYEASLQVWSPATVQASGVTYTASTRVLQFRSASVSNGTAEGALCINSTSAAPLLSRWERCGQRSYVEERERDSKAISAVK